MNKTLFRYNIKKIVLLLYLPRKPILTIPSGYLSRDLEAREEIKKVKGESSKIQ